MPILFFLAMLFADPAWRAALPGYRHQFPRDHFAHPEFRTEWWYYTGNVKTDEGKAYGFELVFFRQGQRRGESPNRSAWRVDDLYLAHLALTDIDAGGFRYHKRLNRAGPGIAGASFERRRVWNGNWSAQWQGERQRLEAAAEGIRLSLDLTPLKPPVIHGANGVSQKAEGEGKASHYVSFSRLAAGGSINGARVTGTAWMDHEWFTHQLEANQAGWDWFSAHLDDGRDLMLFELRRKGGGIDPYSSGTLVLKDGSTRHLRASDFSLQPLETWRSPKTGGAYPVRWRIRVPSAGIDMECVAAVRDQELISEGTGPSYWEGAVRYRGAQSGVGYLEMTGYDKPVVLE